MASKRFLTQLALLSPLCIVLIIMSACSEPNDRKIESYTKAALELIKSETPPSKEDLKIAEELLARAEKAIVFDSTGAINDIGSIAGGYRQLGHIAKFDCDYEAATFYFAKALQLFDIPPSSLITRIFREWLSNPNIVNYEIARVYVDLERYQEAEKYLARIGNDFDYTLTGEIHAGQGRYRQAEAAFRRELEDTTFPGYTKAKLAAVLYAQSKDEKAEKEFRDAIALLEENRENPEASYELARTMSYYSQMLKNLGRVNEAEQYEAQAQTIREERLQQAKEIITEGGATFFYCPELKYLKEF